MKTLVLALSCLATPVWADGAVLLFPAVGSTRQVTVYGRTLKSAPAKSRHSLSKNLKNLLSANEEGAPVEVRFSGAAAKVTSGHDGNFQATFDAPDGGFPVGVQTVEARISGGGLGSATVEVVSDAAPFIVISDFDDTVAVTNVVDKKGLLKAALLEDEVTQPVVPGMSDFYGCLRDVKPDRAGFALVSGSPVQYEPRIRGFLTRHGFPLFGLYLRDLGPTTLSDYKQPVIRTLMKALPHQVVLVGDSGEHDPEVYRQIRLEFPERVLAVYIRDAGRAEDQARFKDMVLFKDAIEAARDAQTRGLLATACVDRAFKKGGQR